MTITLEALAAKINAELRGDGGRVVTGCSTLEDARDGQLSFLANPKYASQLATTQAVGVILGPKDLHHAPAGLPLLVSADPYFAYRQAMVLLHGFRRHPGQGVSPQAFVHPEARLGQGCVIHAMAYIEAGAVVGDRTVIYPHCYIGQDARVGDDCQLFPNVTIYERCVLHNRVTLHAGCVIGQDGFGYATHKGVHEKIPQTGHVVVEDDVEMGAGCVVDRAALGFTRIGAGTKFSDLVAIGHGASIGRGNLFVAQVGIAGSTVTGDYVVMGGQVGVAGHLRIGHQAKLAAKAGVMHDVPDGVTWGGQPAMDMNHTKRSLLSVMKLPDMMGDFRKLQRRVAQLEAQLDGQSAAPRHRPPGQASPEADKPAGA